MLRELVMPSDMSSTVSLTSRKWHPIHNPTANTQSIQIHCRSPTPQNNLATYDQKLLLPLVKWIILPIFSYQLHPVHILIHSYNATTGVKTAQLLVIILSGIFSKRCNNCQDGRVWKAWYRGYACPVYFVPEIFRLLLYMIQQCCT